MSQLRIMGMEERQKPEETHPHLPELKQYSNYLLWKQAQFSNERKYLNWIQIAIAVITVGFLVERLDLGANSDVLTSGLRGGAPNLNLWIPLAFFLLGGIVILIATGEYYLDRRRINQIHPESNTRLDVLILSVLTFLLVIAAVFFVLGLA